MGFGAGRAGGGATPQILKESFSIESPPDFGGFCSEILTIIKMLELRK